MRTSPRMQSDAVSLELERYSDLRGYFGDLFARLRARNPRYSRSAFAKKLGLSASAYCNFMEGRRMLSESSLLSVGGRLGWNPKEVSHAATLRLIAGGDAGAAPAGMRDRISRQARARDRVLGRQVAPPLPTNPTLRLVPSVILGALAVPAYARDPLRIAARLGYSQKLVADELRDLIAQGYVTRDAQGTYHRVLGAQLLKTESSSESIRRYYRQMLAIAIDKVRADNLDRRHYGTETFALDPSLLGEARKIINQCLEDLAALSEQSRQPDSLFHVNIHLFDLLEEPK